MDTNTITVTGCGDCPMSGYDYEWDYHSCRHPDDPDSAPYYSGDRGMFMLQRKCPLKTNSLTIQLKQDAPQT